MRIKILLMAVVLTGLLFSLSASALTVEPPCGELPIRQLNYVTSTEVNKFDPSLGELKSVTLDVDTCGYLWRNVDSEDPFEEGVDATATVSAEIISNIPGLGEKSFSIGTSEQFFLESDNEPNDGSPDWIGTDSYRIELGTANSPECNFTTITLTGAQMAPYIGAGQKVTIPVRTNSSSFVGGSQELASDGKSFMGVVICVIYEYEVPLCINGTKTDACTGDRLPGWEICLKDSNGETINCIETDANGDYSFCGLFPGDYQVCETPQAGWNPVGLTCVPVTLIDVDEVVDFENEQPVCISGFKYNGTTDEGLSGWTIELKNAAGNVIGTDTTDGNGYYEFCDLVPDTSYTVCEVTQPNWTPIGPTCITVDLECEDSENNIFRNRLTPPPPVCGPGCPWFIKNELYTAKCTEIKEVSAQDGILANEMFKNAFVVNPEDIEIDAKYGTITVESDGSFVYDPTGATALRNGLYVIFKYTANNGLCDARYQGIAKIQISCK